MDHRPCSEGAARYEEGKCGHSGSEKANQKEWRKKPLKPLSRRTKAFGNYEDGNADVEDAAAVAIVGEVLHPLLRGLNYTR